MIDFINGVLEEHGDNYVVVENRGIGYKVFVPTSLFSFLPEVGGEVRLYTYLAVKEDGLVLYGFLQKQERELFSLLLRVSGIGPRVALAILGATSADNFYLAVINEDINMLTGIPGIGRKSAQRLILELKEKISSTGIGAGEIAGGSTSLPPNVWFEVREALQLLGYSQEETVKVVKELKQDSSGGSSPEELLRSALQRLSAPGKEERFC